MGDFLKPADLAQHLQTTFTASEEAAAGKAIKRVEALVRTFCGWRISEETVTDEAHDGGPGVIYLPTNHLTAVSAVVENGSTLTYSTHYTWSRQGVLRRAGGYWYPDYDSVVVSYTHGYAKGSDELLALADIVASIVSRRWENPGGARSETTGGITDVYAIPASGLVPSGLLYSEQEALLPFRLMVV